MMAPLAPDHLDDRVCDRFILWLAANPWRVAAVLCPMILGSCWLDAWVLP